MSVISALVCREIPQWRQSVWYREISLTSKQNKRTCPVRLWICLKHEGCQIVYICYVYLYSFVSVQLFVCSCTFLLNSRLRFMNHCLQSRIKEDNVEHNIMAKPKLLLSKIRVSLTTVSQTQQAIGQSLESVFLLIR